MRRLFSRAVSRAGMRRVGTVAIALAGTFALSGCVLVFRV